MPKTREDQSLFEKVGECLYRYRPSGGYYARLEVGGKEIRRSLKTTDKTVAKSNLAALRQELGEIDLSAGKMTLKELCDRYLDTIQDQKESTREGKKLVVKRIKENWPGGANCQVRDVKPSDALRFVSQQTSHAGKSLYNHHVFVVRAIFQLAVEDRLLARSPAEGLKQKQRDRPIRRTPSFEDFQAIVANIRAQSYNADCEDSANFIEFLGLAGLGQAEASSLTWGDVNWARDEVTTFRHKTSNGFLIPIYPQLRALLERLKGTIDRGPEERVLAIDDAKKALAGACKRLGLPAYSQRALRRMFITRAIEKGVDVKVIAEWQGHRDGGKLILDTYSHVSRSHAKRMATLMS